MIFSKPIVLVGMMGCGKSTIGKIVAEKLKWIFIDTDKEIESIMKLSIKEIFERFGESRLACKNLPVQLFSKYFFIFF